MIWMTQIFLPKQETERVRTVSPLSKLCSCIALERNSMFQLADSHCHLQDPRFDPDREAVLDRALAGLSLVVVVGDALVTSAQAVMLAKRPGVRAVVGVHPYHASEVTDAVVSQLRDLVTANSRETVAVGETGLDYYNEFSPRQDQRRAFERHAVLAASLGLPLVVHNRQADDDTLALLREHRAGLPGVILHCFGSGPAEAETFAELNCHISFAGNLTYPRAENLREAARRVPDHLLLAETDAPYLAPQPVRGQRCEPAHVMHTVAALAALRGEPVDSMADRIARNAARVYQVGLDDTPLFVSEAPPDV